MQSSCYFREVDGLECEFMAINTGLLLAVLEVPRVARAYVRALKVADKHLSEICPAADGVGGQEI